MDDYEGGSGGSKGGLGGFSRRLMGTVASRFGAGGA
jgi:hypothetical protein